MSPASKAIRTYLVMTGLRSFLFWTIFITGSLYYIKTVGLDPLQLVLVGTVLELTCFVCEIPTGVIADVYSRKLSIIIGFAIMGIAFAIQGVFATFAAILIAQLFYGAGWTFISGAEDAWLADEIGNDRLAHTYLRGKQSSLVASFLGIFSSVGLGSISLGLPYVVSGLAFIAVAGLLIVLMPETNFRPVASSERGAWSRMTETLRSGLNSIRVSPLLITVLVITLIYGISREGIDRLWEAHILAAVQLPVVGNLSMVVWFGIINAIAMLVALLLSFVLQRWIKSLGTRQALIWLVGRYTLLGASIIAFALTRSFVWIVAAYVAVHTLRELGDAVQRAWINRSIESTSRATVLSTISQMDALGEGGGGPLLGVIGVRLGLRASMLAASALLVPVVGLFGRIYRQQRSS